MATRTDREEARFTRDNIDRAARARGHDPAWRLAPNATRKGHAYYFEGTCSHCHAHASAGPAWSSSHGVIDLRSATRCGGPGTHVLTDIEAARQSELLAPVIAEFFGHVRRAIAAQN
jgi:hypothetical protein